MTFRGIVILMTQAGLCLSACYKNLHVPKFVELLKNLFAARYIRLDVLILCQYVENVLDVLIHKFTLDSPKIFCQQ